tara:strand:+ start:193805 stop:194500 length:696 start_codon:yes stop_codon:yes gene_type:complete
MYGVDVWHAYELSWLDAQGKPVARVGRFEIPATSPGMVESKSFKLYLNSLNSTRFDAEQDAVDVITRDISSVVGAPVTLQVFAVDDLRLAGVQLAGECIDALLMPDAPSAQPSASLLRLHGQSEVADEQLYSHLLRSLCPVTGQPDWASVWIHYGGATIDRQSLLHYLVSYRQHQEFHEQCVERMFDHIQSACNPRFLSVQACYTRRGGLDINPFRSSDPLARPLPRLNRQ